LLAPDKRLVKITYRSPVSIKPGSPDGLKPGGQIFLLERMKPALEKFRAKIDSLEVKLTKLSQQVFAGDIKLVV
jgi:hypothetical protein